MPAVQLARLRLQIDQLLQKIASPPDFRRGLIDLFEFYADHTYRPAVTAAVPIDPVYHVAPFVLRQLELALAKQGGEQPAEYLAAADLLWQETYLEPRIVAAILLGCLPVDYQPAVLERLESWIRPDVERSLQTALLHQASAGMRRQSLESWFELIQNWLQHSEISYQAMGLRALLPLIEDESFENLPAVFSLIAPLMKNQPALVQNELLMVLQALARRSPGETGYLLRQIVSISNNPALIRIARRCLPLLSPSQQSSLRGILVERGR